MYLSDTDIKQAVEEKRIVIDEYDPSRVQPASYDVLLGSRFMLPESERDQVIDPVKGVEPHYRNYEVVDGEFFVLHPSVSVLAQTKERFGSDEFLITLSGKSSLARIGLVIHNTAGIVNPGHYLNMVLELYNLSHVPIILRPGMPIAQLLFSKLTSPPSKSYQDTGRYSEENWKSYIPPKQS